MARHRFAASRRALSALYLLDVITGDAQQARALHCAALHQRLWIAHVVAHVAPPVCDAQGRGAFTRPQLCALKAQLVLSRLLARHDAQRAAGSH